MIPIPIKDMTAPELYQFALKQEKIIAKQYAALMSVNTWNMRPRIEELIIKELRGFAKEALVYTDTELGIEGRSHD